MRVGSIAYIKAERVAVTQHLAIKTVKLYIIMGTKAAKQQTPNTDLQRFARADGWLYLKCLYLRLRGSEL